MLHTALKFDLYMLEERASVFEQGTVACGVQHQRNFVIVVVFSMNSGNVHKYVPTYNSSKFFGNVFTA